MKDLNLYILTFNCARTLIQPDVFGSYIFEALPQMQRADLPDILVLTLQELAPIGYSFLGGSFVTPYFNAFRKAVKIAAGDGKYINVIARNVGMTAIMVFAKPELAAKIEHIHTAGVGVGVHDMGNKGAAGVRLGLRVDEEGTDIMETTFVAAHLAAMEDALQRRNADWANIVRRLVFTDDKSGKSIPQDEQSEEAPLLQGMPDDKAKGGLGMFTPHSHLFFAGDLNYRISSTKPSADAYREFPKPKVPRNDSFHYSHYLKDDQLSKERSERRTLHGLDEASIDFPPTYKYSNKPRPPAQTDDVEAWDWSKHRYPSWCDRILYLDLPKWMQSTAPEAAIQIFGYKALPLFLTSDHRPVALAVTIPFMSIPSPNSPTADVRISPPFDIDPDWKTSRAVARRKELMVGLAAYLGLTWEGSGLLLATIIGAVGGYFVIKALLAV